MKKWFDPLSSAWIGLLTHKLRSILTMLGIVIGVGAVIALMSVGKGVEADIISNIQTLGSDLIIISPGASTGFGGIKGDARSTQTLTLEDATSIAEQVDYVDIVAPSNTTNLQLVFGDENTNTLIIGVTTEYMQAYNLNVAIGSFFTVSDYERGANVAVLGANVAETLFGSVDLIGQQIRMGNNVVRIIGILESKGVGIGSPDDSMLIPLSTLQKTAANPLTSKGESVVSLIALTVSDGNQTDYVVGEITSLLRARHQLGFSVDDDFSVNSMEELISIISETVGTLTLLLGAIAAISLLVGGIGVMNIMLVSVLERTREIGIRKALGARERDIWGQFLIEAVFLTFAGGIIGIFLGWGIASIINHFWEMSTLVTADIIILAVSVSAGIGLFFGFYPAWNASRLNPIEALRSE